MLLICRGLGHPCRSVISVKMHSSRYVGITLLCEVFPSQFMVLRHLIMGWLLFFITIMKKKRKERKGKKRSYLTRVLANIAYKHYASKEVFCGIKSKTNIKIWFLSKISTVKSNIGILLPAAVKLVNRKVL